jgi:hypothetical protein
MMSSLGEAEAVNPARVPGSIRVGELQVGAQPLRYKLIGPSPMHASGFGSKLKAFIFRGHGIPWVLSDKSHNAELAFGCKPI